MSDEINVEEGGPEELSLKWGTIKGWTNASQQTQALLRQYFSDGQPLSAMADRPDESRKRTLCDLIDQLNGTIYLDWDGKYVSKDEAKRYVMEYRS